MRLLYATAAPIELFLFAIVSAYLVYLVIDISIEKYKDHKKEIKP